MVRRYLHGLRDGIEKNPTFSAKYRPLWDISYISAEQNETNQMLFTVVSSTRIFAC